MRICALLPAYNEAASIVPLVNEIRACGIDAIVVDDGSHDGTGDRAAAAYAIVLRHNRNRGKGAALRTGFEYVVQQGYDAVLVLDADGQHAPSEITGFIQAAEQPAGVVVGNRMHNPQGMPFVRKWTNIITSATVSWLAGQRIPDCQCGFRLLKTDVLKTITLTTDNFDTESEMLIRASWHGFTILSVPVRTIYADEQSKIHPIKDTIRFWRLIFTMIAEKKKCRGT